MTQLARPRFLWKGWAPFVAVLVISAVSISGFFFADRKTDHAVKVAKESAVAEAAREQERADLAICRIAAKNAERSVTLIRGLIGLIEMAPPSVTPQQEQSRQTALDELNRQLSAAQQPFPPPCDTLVIN